MNRIEFEVQEVKRLMGLKVHQYDFKPTTFLKWWSAVAFMR